MAATVASITHAVGSAGGTGISFTVPSINSAQALIVVLDARDNTGASYASSTWNAVNNPADETGNGTLTDGCQFHRLGYRNLTGSGLVLAITLGAAQDDWEGWAIVLDNPHATTLLGALDNTGVTETGVFDGCSGTVSATTDDIAFLVYRVRADVTASLTEGGGQTELDGPQLSGNGNTIGIMSEAGAGSVTMTAAWDGSSFPTWAAEVFVIQGASGGGASIVPIINHYMRLKR